MNGLLVQFILRNSGGTGIPTTHHFLRHVPSQFECFDYCNCSSSANF